MITWGAFNFSSGHAADPGMFEMEASGSYEMARGDPKPLSRELAIFLAKRTATEVAEKYFSRRNLISPLGKKRDEIINYTADSVEFRILNEKWRSCDSAGECEVRLRVFVQPSDFIKAQIESLNQEKIEADDSLRKEMEPTIAAHSPPGHDIAKAYHLIGRGELRKAIIYLDRLRLKYPNWSDVYEVTALAFDLHGKVAKKKEALQKACELGSHNGCVELEMIAPKAIRRWKAMLYGKNAD
jgi:hypothetical protein